MKKIAYSVTVDIQKERERELSEEKHDLKRWNSVCEAKTQTGKMQKGDARMLTFIYVGNNGEIDRDC
jgi:hypothetical protein